MQKQQLRNANPNPNPNYNPNPNSSLTATPTSGNPSPSLAAGGTAFFTASPHAVLCKPNSQKRERCKNV